jgi:hypothetical protein
MKTTIASAALCCLACLAAAQTDGGRVSFFHGSQLYTGVHAEVWNFEGQQTWEVVLPIYYSLGLDALATGLAVDAVTSPVLGLLNGPNAGTLARVAGSKIRASYNFRDFVLFTAGLQVPTSPNKLSTEEQNVVSWLATPEMEFKVSDVQSGLNGNVSASSSYRVNDDFVLGGGIGYLLRGQFVPVDGGGEFDPGDEFTATLGGDYGFLLGRTSVKIMAEYMFTVYGTDRLAGNKVFRAAPRNTINLRFDVKPARGLRDLAVLSLNIYGKNRILSASLPPIQRGRTDIFLLTDYLYFAKTGAVSPFILATARLYAQNGGGGGDAFVAGLGGGGAFAVSRALSIRAQAALDGGTLNGSGMFGVEINGGISYVF